MDRIRKWMTIAAIVGTVLVTAVFCYMPVREVIKEYKKNTVSMEKEHTIGTPEDSAESLYENMTNASESAGNGAVPGEGIIQEKSDVINAADKKEMGRIVFSFGDKGQKLQTALWVNEEDVGYVFLPGFAKGKPLQVTEIAGGDYFILGGQKIREGDVVENLSYEEAYAFTLIDKKGKAVAGIPLIFMYS